MTTTKTRVAEVMAWLEEHGSARVRDGMSRYGIATGDRVFGVAVGDLQKYGKRLGRDHALALALWDTGCYEARMLTSFVDEPSLVTAAQMDRFAKDFDNWAIVDTLCFKLWDQVPHAWKKVDAWSRSGEEFVKRAGFALLACLALHDRETGDAPFAKALRLVEKGADDDRNFVKKGVSWALRSIGRRSAALHAASIELAEKLASSDVAASRWIGKDTLRDLAKPAVKRKFAAKKKKA